jgi:hypothetical protein
MMVARMAASCLLGKFADFFVGPGYVTAELDATPAMALLGPGGLAVAVRRRSARFGQGGSRRTAHGAR